MSKLASKLSKRIMATALSVAMVMSNMTVYANELTGPQVEKAADESAVDPEDTLVTTDDATSDEDAVTDDTADVTTEAPVGDPDDTVVDNDDQTTQTGEDETKEPEESEEVTEDTEVTGDGSLENEEEVKEEGIVSRGLARMGITADEPNFDYNSNLSVDVWDFGAADFTDKDVNSMLTATNSPI